MKKKDKMKEICHRPVESAPAALLSDALGDVGEDLMLDAMAHRETQKTPRRRMPGKQILRIGALAAAVLLVVGTVGVTVRTASLRTFALATVTYPAETLKLRGQLLNGNTDSFWSFVSSANATVLGDTEPGENRLWAPASAYMALGMLSEITCGEGQEQILSLLGGCSAEVLRKEASLLWQANYVDDGKARCFLDNALWLDRNTACAQEIADVLASDYYASTYRGEMGSAAFDRAFRTWLNQKTEGMLRSEVSKQQFKPYPEQVMAITSTMTLAARWNEKFDKSLTKAGEFYASDGTVTVDYMHADRQKMIYYWSDTFGAISLPFDHFAGSMWLILPDEGVEMSSVLADEGLWAILSDHGYENNKYLYVNLTMPKFDVTSTLDLKESLQTLGVTSVFDTANTCFRLSGNAGDEIWISSVSQSVRVRADEDGCKATTFLVMPGCGAAMPPEDEIDFICDRPFLFIITGTGQVPLFAGVINHP